VSLGCACLTAAEKIAEPPPAAPPATNTAATERAQVERLLRDDYLLEGSVSFPAGLFHWVDSLAGTSGGKTIPQYREEFYRTFGALGEAKPALASFRSIRLAHARRNGVGGSERGASSMLGVFLAADTLDAAFEDLKSQLSPDESDRLRAALEQLAPKYRTLWNGGARAREFLDNAKRNPSRADLEKLMAAMARFLGVDPKTEPAPRIVPVPVPAGGGTHAEAVGRYLLIEIRPGETVIDEAAPIVHENAHFLWYRIGDQRAEKLEAAARVVDSRGFTWRLLHEALPTALGQGVAARRFQREHWSPRAGWYHIDEIDECAKRIYPLVQKAMDDGAVLDEELMTRMVRVARE